MAEIGRSAAYNTAVAYTPPNFDLSFLHCCFLEKPIDIYIRIARHTFKNVFHLFIQQINYIVSDSEFHILNSWRREDQSTHEVIRRPQSLHFKALPCRSLEKCSISKHHCPHFCRSFLQNRTCRLILKFLLLSHSSCQLWQLLGHPTLARTPSVAASCMGWLLQWRRCVRSQSCSTRGERRWWTRPIELPTGGVLSALPMLKGKSSIKMVTKRKINSSHRFVQNRYV